MDSCKALKRIGRCVSLDPRDHLRLMAQLIALLVKLCATPIDRFTSPHFVLAFRFRFSFAGSYSQQYWDRGLGEERERRSLHHRAWLCSSVPSFFSPDVPLHCPHDAIVFFAIVDM